jgi:hypothetical protein
MYYNLDKIKNESIVKLDDKEHVILDIKVKDIEFYERNVKTFDGQLTLINKFIPTIEVSDLKVEEITLLIIAIQEKLTGEKINLQNLLERVRE